MSDLDDLLNELDVSQDSIGSPPPPKPARTQEKTRGSPLLLSKKPDGAGGGKADSLDDLLDHLETASPTAHDISAQKLAAPAPASAPADEPAVRSTGKCYPVYIGGSESELGMSPGRACDRLRCTKCDFEVIRIKDVQWSESCDYLFFRNFYPDQKKLKEKFKPRQGYCSYCCQCTWRSTADLDSISNQADIRWICSGHGR